MMEKCCPVVCLGTSHRTLRCLCNRDKIQERQLLKTESRIRQPWIKVIVETCSLFP